MFVTAAPTPESHPLFINLPPTEAAALLKQGTTHLCKRGESLFRQGDPIRHFYLLTQGTIQLYRTNAQGDEKTVHILKSGQIIGEGEIMDGCSAHRMNAKAIADSTLLSFSASWLKETAKRYPEFALNLLSLLAQENHLAEIEAEHQATMSAAQLVACFLQRICVLYDYDPRKFTLPYPKSLIASRLGMEFETFSRTLAKLRENGIVVTGNEVSIQDLGQIAQYVCSICSIAEDCTTHHDLTIKVHKK